MVEKILLINACIRPESRTLRMAKHLLYRLGGQVEEVNLENEAISALNSQSLKYRLEILATEKFDDPMLRYARQFKEADTIVIAAPYYDVSFPSSLKNYLEAICCVGLTFYYDEKEVAQTLCRAKRVYYVSSGGGAVNKNYGFEYVKALVREFFHISDVQGFFAEKLDLLGSDPEAIMEAAIANIDAAFDGKVFNKLVRDKIPDIIRKSGANPTIRTLNDGEYVQALRDKLNEEVAEFHAENNTEELADILEVAFSLAENMDCSREELLALCDQKRILRGGFEARQFLISRKDS